jgi:glucans biosynthesis protein C
MSASPASLATSRRYDLDWLRIIAFGLLILYHTGMYYVTWDFHIKSPHAARTIEPLMLFVNPWRMDLLFLISGVATRYMLDGSGALRTAGLRFNRLFWPLLFSMFVIVPPQSFYELVEQIHYTGSYLDFYAKYATAYQGWCDADGCLITPTWNHMWFVAYLLVYSLILCLLWPVLKLFTGGKVRIPAILVFVLPWLYLWLTRATLSPIFGETHALVDDVYVHSVSVFMFLLGVYIARADGFFEIARKGRFVAAGLGLTAYGLIMLAYFHIFPGLTDESWVYVGPLLKSAQAWFMLLALLGFARQHLSHADGPVRRTLTEAIFPFYIVHQTIIIIAAHNLNRLHLPVWLEAASIIGLTVAGCWLTYVVASRVIFLRPLFGLSLKRRLPG